LQNILLLRRQKIPEHRSQLLSEAAGSRDRFELSVDVLGVTLLANADAAYDYHVMVRINSVNDAVVAEPVLPIAGQRSAQRQPVSFRVNGELLLQHLSQLSTHTAVESFDIRCRVSSVSKFKGGLERVFLTVTPRTKAVFGLCSFAKNICCCKQPASGNVSVNGFGQGYQAVGEFAVGEDLQSCEH
jgi:hypothetical protein